MKTFGILTIDGKIDSILPYNPFTPQIMELLSRGEGQNTPNTQAELLGSILNAVGMAAYLGIANIPGTNLGAINWDTDVVLHELILYYPEDLANGNFPRGNEI